VQLWENGRRVRFCSELVVFIDPHVAKCLYVQRNISAVYYKEIISRPYRPVNKLNIQQLLIVAKEAITQRLLPKYDNIFYTKTNMYLKQITTKMFKGDIKVGFH